MDSLFDHRITGLNPTAEVVFRRMLHFTGDNGVCYGDPSIVSALIRFPSETVGLALADMERAGLADMFESGGMRFVKFKCFSEPGVVGVARCGFPEPGKPDQKASKGNESKREEVWVPDRIQCSINSIFGRRPTTRWSNKEQASYCSVEITDEDLQLVVSYYKSEKSNPDNRLRTSILTLLNNWAGEVDRARNYFELKKNTPVEGRMRAEEVETRTLI
jgi:hypothetical protein